jgi:hypothetical protein
MHTTAVACVTLALLAQPTTRADDRPEVERLAQQLVQ